MIVVLRLLVLLHMVALVESHTEATENELTVCVVVRYRALEICPPRCRGENFPVLFQRFTFMVLHYVWRPA